MRRADELRLDALAQAIARIEGRLARVERALGVETPAPPPEPAAAPAPEPVAEPQRGFETRMGLTWVNRVGVVTLVLGAAFFFKYAVESGWIGETARVALGLAAGGAALAAGERLWRGGQQVYAQGISAAGIGILYLTCYAAFGLYHMLPQAPAFLLMAFATAAAIGLALRYDAVALAALGLAGGFATPLLLGAASGYFVPAYALLLDAGALYASRKRGWRSIEGLAAAGTAWVYGAQLAPPVPPDRRAVETVFALAYYGLFAARGVRRTAAAMQLLAAVAIAVVWEAALWPYLALALLLAASGLVLAARRGWPMAAFAAFWLSYAIWNAEGTRPDGPVFWFLAAAFLLFLGWLWRGRARIEDLLLSALNAGLYFAAGYAVLATADAAFLGLFAAAEAAAYMALAYALWERSRRAAVLAAGVSWALLVVAAPAQFSGYRITMVWALEGAALAWIGTRMRESRAFSAALAVFALVLLRLAIFDSHAGARFPTFAVAAASMWAAAWWMRAHRLAAAPYVAGHFAALWGLGLEVLDWSARHAAAANLRSVESTSLSILMAAYAVMLVSIGVFAGRVLDRALGLGLIAVVVAKLYLYDVWFLGLFYRMAAFAVLGALLLAMSYLYSRFRGSLESWWRDRRTG